MVTVNAKNPYEKNWEEFILETENVLSVSTGGGYLFARYNVDVSTKVFQYDFQGNNMGEIKLPGIGTARGWSGKIEDETL